jgi:hypothetical protein
MFCPKERFNAAYLEVESLHDEVRLMRGRLDDLEDSGCSGKVGKNGGTMRNPKKPWSILKQSKTGINRD